MNKNNHSLTFFFSLLERAAEPWERSPGGALQSCSSMETHWGKVWAGMGVVLAAQHPQTPPQEGVNSSGEPHRAPRLWERHPGACPSPGVWPLGAAWSSWGTLASEGKSPRAKSEEFCHLSPWGCGGGGGGGLSPPTPTWEGENKIPWCPSPG